MRIPQPHWKESHKCWYVKLNGKFHRLDPDEAKAKEVYAELLKRECRDECQVDLASPNVTVRSILTAFLKWVEKHKSAGTFGVYSDHCQRFAKYAPAKLLVRDLKPLHITGWLDKDFATAGDNTRAGAITSIKRAFNWAVDEGYIAGNPIQRVKKPAYIPRGDEAYITPEHWGKIVATVEGGLSRGTEVASFVDYLTMLRETGCRPQELRIFEAKHLDAVNGLLKLSIKQSKAGKKTKRGRIIPLSDAALEICKRLAAKYPSGPLFRNSDGKPWKAFAVANRFARLEKKGCGALSAYMFRHTFATDEILKGTDLITLQNIMGHSDLTMLSQIYEHVMRAKSMSDVRNRHKPASVAADATASTA